MEKDEDATLKAFADCEKILKKLLKKYQLTKIMSIIAHIQYGEENKELITVFT